MLPAKVVPGPAHALLSASGAKRWMACTPSARLEETLPDSESDFAAEGTAAHALAEALLRYHLHRIDKKEYTAILNGTKNLCREKGWCLSMIEHVEGYVARVLESYASARMETPDAMIFLEQRLDYSYFVPDGFGTGDVNILSHIRCRFRDLKYGKGVAVTAEDNEQLMIYGLGAILEFGYMFPFEEVELTIDQPRLDSITTVVIKTVDLIAWGEKILRPLALLAYEGKGEYNPGDACKFCRAKAICAANAEYQLKLAKYAFRNPALLSDDDISKILKQLDSLTDWAESVKAHAFAEALKGKVWPGHKLIYGRADRYYSDEVAVIKKLKKNGFTDAQLYQPKKILGIGAMETLVTKKLFSELLDGLVVKPNGKPTLVPNEKTGTPFVLQAEAADVFSKISDTYTEEELGMWG